MKRRLKRKLAPASAAVLAAALGQMRTGSGTTGTAGDPLGEIRTSLATIVSAQEGLGTRVTQALEAGTRASQDIAALRTALETATGEARTLRGQVDDLRRQMISKALDHMQRRPGAISEEAAGRIAACFVLGNARSGALDSLEARDRERMIESAARVIGSEVRAALTTADIALPVEHSRQIRELTSEFGVCRSRMTRYPIGRGTAKPPRMKTRPAFGSIAMSAAVPEKSPQVETASLESHKIGGIVRVPREIDEQALVDMGQFLARYGAIEFARAEDLWGFLADGTATYESVKGITKIAVDNTKNVQLGATKTKPSDATLADFRAMRLKTNAAALGMRSAAYYLHATWESRLRDFNTAADQYAYVPNRPGDRNAQGGPALDGYPIVWTDVMEPYGTVAAASKFLAVFGCLDYWYFGEHGNPRLEYSRDVYFTTDEIGARFLEEIDFDYQDVGATASLQTAAA